MSVDDVLAIHADTISHEGGLAGLRDPGLLESAVTMPQQRFAGKWLHAGHAAMAAAYLYHLARNHPFLDGNKRTAAMAALVFLDVNGRRKLPPPKALETVTLGVASGTITKDELIDWMKRQLRRRRTK